MRIIQHPSPNFGARPCPVDCVVLHATADSDTQASIEWCCTPRPKNPNPVSYHVIIDRDGTTYHLVDSAKRAWHAGVSELHGRANVNDFSIGLSFANRNDGKEPYADRQYAAAASLIVAWMGRYPKITLDRITTHREIARPVGRKTDPLGFDVAKLKRFIVDDVNA